MLLLFLWNRQGCGVLHGHEVGLLQSPKGNFWMYLYMTGQRSSKNWETCTFWPPGAHVWSHDGGNSRSWMEHDHCPALLGAKPKSQSLVLYSGNQCSIYLHISITSFLVPFYAMSLASVKTKEISNKSVTKMTVSSRWWQAGILYVTRDGSRPAAQPIMLVYIGTTWWGLGPFWSHLRSSPVLLGLNMVDCQKHPHGPQFQEAAWISPALSFCRYSCNQYVTRTVNSEKNTKWWFFSFLISTNHLLPVNA